VLQPALVNVGGVRATTARATATATARVRMTVDRNE
jgi:hypothetical protein